MVKLEMNERLIKLGLDSHMLNYIDNETPRRYFLSAHADEDDLQKFAELILKQCLSYVDDSFGDVDYVKFMIKRDFGVEG